MSQSLDPSVYGPAFAAVLRDVPPMPLDEGEADQSMRATLEALTLESAFAEQAIRDSGAADCCLAGAWLLHGYLDEAHTLCQAVPSASGSYWHGIMHRREGDYGNAAYWFRRAGDHPAGAMIAAAAAEHPETVEAALGGRWDPFRFNEQVQQACQQGGQLASVCRDVQQAEWHAMFDFCWREAIG